MHDKVIVHASMAGRLGGCVYHTANHTKPTRGFQQVRLHVPVASRNPGAFDGLEAKGGLLKQVHVGGREPLTVLKVDVQDVNASFTHTRHP